MPNCTTVVQTGNDLCEPEIRRNSLKKSHFSALFPTKKAPENLRYRSVKQSSSLRNQKTTYSTTLKTLFIVFHISPYFVSTTFMLKTVISYNLLFRCIYSTT